LGGKVNNAGPFGLIHLHLAETGVRLERATLSSKTRGLYLKAD
jgi:hypothetical protein